MIVLILTLIFFIVWWLYEIYMRWKKTSPGPPPSSSPDPPPDEIEKIENIEGITPASFRVSEKGAASGPERIKMNWQHFVEAVSDAAFIRQFHAAILYATEHKIRRYRSILARMRAAKVAHTFDRNPENVEEELQKVIQELQMRLRSQTLTKTQTDLQAATEYAQTIVSRDNIKDFLAMQLYSFSRCPEVFLTNFQNMLILGESGIGKTKLAQTIGKIYARCGILARGGNIRETTKSDFVTAYVNESARLTRKVLLNSLETVLFIDEAYDITPEKSPLYGKGLDHGGEAVTELVNFLDKYIGLTVVIAAGYAKDMYERFLGANQGMPRRFPHVLSLTPYSAKELFQICTIALGKNKIVLNPAQAAYLWGAIECVYTKYPRVFDKQGGDAINLAAIIARQTYSTLDTNLSSHFRSIILDSMHEFAKTKGVVCSLYEQDIATPSM